MQHAPGLRTRAANEAGQSAGCGSTLLMALNKQGLLKLLNSIARCAFSREQGQRSGQARPTALGLVYLHAALSREQGQRSGQAVNPPDPRTDNGGQAQIFTDDVSLKVFMEHLLRLATEQDLQPSLQTS